MSPNQPVYLGRNHSRRCSSRKSFAPSLVDSPRTLCPRDGEAFSFDPAHLPEWDMPQDLWGRLPEKLKTTVVTMQHSGAAVLTGFERLEMHREDLDEGSPADKLQGDEFIDQLSPLPLSVLPPPKLRTTSDASSTFYSDAPSPVFTDTPNSGSTSPSLSGSQVTSPISPMCLNPFDSLVAQKPERPRERSFSTPREPRDAYYAAELSHLRTEAITRLRHITMKVRQDWTELKKEDKDHKIFSENEMKIIDDWLSNKNDKVAYFTEVVKRMSSGIGLSPNGMGWTVAP